MAIVNEITHSEMLAKAGEYKPSNVTGRNARNIKNKQRVTGLIVAFQEKAFDDINFAAYGIMENAQTGQLSFKIGNPTKDLPKLTLGTSVTLEKVETVIDSKDVHYMELKAVNAVAQSTANETAAQRKAREKAEAGK